MRYSLMASCLLVTGAMAAEWSQFRGPNGDGHASSKHLPVKWNESENITWKQSIPGRGWSSPVVSDGTIWLTTAVETPMSPEQIEAFRAELKKSGNPIANQMAAVGSVSLRAVAIDFKTGKILKNIELFHVSRPDGIHSLNSYASPSPILGEGRLFCHFGRYGTACVETKTGKILWQVNLPNNHSVGPGSSPVLFEDLLIVPCDGTEAQYVTALRIGDGTPAWRVNRPKMKGDLGDLHKAFSTPLVITVAGQPQVVIPGAQWDVAYEPRTGKEIWRVNHGEGFSTVPRPVFANGLVYLCTGYMRPELWAIRPDGQGDVTDTHVAWKYKKQVPAMPSPVVVGKEIYFVSDQGVATCVDALTGTEIWQKRVDGNYSASPMHCDGKIYLGNREGQMIILKAGRTFERLEVNSLDGQILATPAVVSDALLLRTNTHLYRVESSPQQG